MKKQQKRSTEEQIKQRQKFDLEEIKKEVDKLIDKTPTRIYEKGDRVCWGVHEEVYIEEVLYGSFAYKLRTVAHRQEGVAEHVQPIEGTISYYYKTWVDIFPYRVLTNKSCFAVHDSVQLIYMNSDLTSLFSKHYYFGIDYTPEYQREYVWTLEDKVSLIDSIMHNIDIGKFTFIHLTYEESLTRPNRSLYEILDGKQRMQALTDFYEDRFEYHGKVFSELGFEDRNKFTGHHVSFAELKNLTKEQILRTFIKLNTTGKVMDATHIEKVRQEWLKELKKVSNNAS